MKPTTKLTATIAAKPPKEFPEIMAMTTEQLVEKIRLALERFYSEGLYSVHLAQMARAIVLLTEYANAEPTVVTQGPVIREGFALLEVPLEHVPAIEATLGYLTGGK
jgi:hypothetical protein